MIAEELQQKFRRLYEERVARDEAKTKYDKLKDDYDEHEQELWDEVEESPLSGAIKIDLGEPYGTITFQAKETHYGRILDNEKALEAFEQSARVDELTEPKIAMARLHEYVRECVDGNMPLPDGVDWYAKRYISITVPKS